MYLVWYLLEAGTDSSACVISFCLCNTRAGALGSLPTLPTGTPRLTKVDQGHTCSLNGGRRWLGCSRVPGGEGSDLIGSGGDVVRWRWHRKTSRFS